MSGTFVENPQATSNVLERMAVETKDPTVADACRRIQAKPGAVKTFATALDHACVLPGTIVFGDVQKHCANGQILQILLAALPNIENFVKELVTIFDPTPATGTT